MKKENKILLWLKELVARFGTKSPTFFKIIQYVGLATTALLGLPEYINDLTDLGFKVPQLFTDQTAKIMFWSGIVAYVVGKLPTQNVVVGTTTTGEPVKATSDKLPFTKEVESNMPIQPKEDKPIMP